MAERQLIVKTIGLTKVFKDFWRRDKVVAVNDLNIEIHQGQVFGLLGPNGSGKSTTIKVMLGLLYPTRGRVSIFGKPPTDVAIKSRIGYLPEESYLYRFLNARETLQLYGKLFRQDREVREHRIDELLEMVGLQHQARRRIGEYSKGMARRIGLAQALINDPDFLILDEPTTGLDPIGTQQIKTLIRELARRGKTILLSSHLLADVQDVCDQVCILYGGRVQAEGRLAQLLSHGQSTCITAPHLGAETIAEIKDLIHRREHHDDVTVDHPVERLEHFFVRIVEQAQQAQTVTSGVQAGGELPDFLSEDEGEGLVESLVAAAREPAAPEDIVEAVAEPEVEEQVIVDLVTPKPAPPSEPAPAAEEQQVPADDSVDRELIDDLLGGSEQRRG